jgi:predicted helicase
LKTIDYVFPLYLYQDAELPKKGRGFGTTMMLFESETPYQVRSANLDKTFVETLSKAYGKKPTPEEIFYYIYAVLYANTYRARYAEFLKTDFPRVPFTKNHKLFVEMGKLGKQLVELHLLKAPDLERPAAHFQGKGDNRLEKQRYDDKEQRVYVNAAQYFEGIEKDVWDYQIGGYQVMDKWLKDRKGRILSLEDIQHYCRIATALKKTIEIQADIDTLYPKIESDVVTINLEKQKT